MSTLKTHNLQSPDAGSVNIIMAPNAGMVVAGLSTYSNQINVGSNIKLGTAGVVTATSFIGGLPITSGVDNRVITASSASAIQGESNLTFNGSRLSVTGDVYISGSQNSQLTSNQLIFDRAGFSYIDQTNDSGSLVFRVTASNTTALRLDSDAQSIFGAACLLYTSDAADE